MCYRCKKDGSIREPDNLPTVFPTLAAWRSLNMLQMQWQSSFFKVADKWKTVLTVNAVVRGFTSPVHGRFLGCVPYCSKNFPIGVITKVSTGKTFWKPCTECRISQKRRHRLMHVALKIQLNGTKTSAGSAGLLN